jgi:hypothetical protein
VDARDEKVGSGVDSSFLILVLSGFTNGSSMGEKTVSKPILLKKERKTRAV